MGSSNYSDSLYAARAAHRAATNTPTFAHHAAQQAAPPGTAKIHDKLNPKGVKIRESRDSDAHPDAHAVAVLFDITGSMGVVPQTLQANLPKLMGLLIRNGYLPHPHIMAGGIGDANTDRAILQVGQFEAGIEIDDDLTNLWLEGNGGGQVHESYELAMYFMARHTSIDCLEKRGKKGYLFIIGDEMPYATVRRSQVAQVIGDSLEADIPTKDIVQELQTKYEVFFVLPRMTHYWDNAEVHAAWKELLGERFLRLEQPEAICELIASTIALCEGSRSLDEISTDLVAAGTSAANAASVSTALAVVSKTTKQQGELATVPDSGAGSGLAKV